MGGNCSIFQGIKKACNGKVAERAKINRFISSNSMWGRNWKLTQSLKNVYTWKIPIIRNGMEASTEISQQSFIWLT